MQFSRVSSALMILVLLLSAIGVNPVRAARVNAPDLQSTSWFDAAWSYRRPVAISNSGSAVADYQVLITLNSSFAFAHANSDGSDIHITDAGGTSLPFWIETWDPAANLGRIWVMVPSIPTSGATIYLYYGNSDASPASNGSATFDFFDNDWLNLDGRWHINGGNPSINNGVISFSSGATMQTSMFYAPGHALGYRGWFKSGGGTYKWGGFLNGVNTPYTYIGTVGDGSTAEVALTNNTTGSRRWAGLGLPTDTYHIYEIAWTSSVVRAFLDRAVSPTAFLTQDIPTSTLPIQLGNYNDFQTTFEVDWVYLRQYQEPEPILDIGPEVGNQTADLELSLSDSPDPVMAGDLLSYSITITNHGPLAATGVVLTDTLPSGVTLDSATADQGTCSGIETVICSIGDMAIGSAVPVTISIRAAAPGTVVNSASVSGNEADSNTGNNSASASTTVNDPSTANLGITQSDLPDPVRAGDSLTYTIVVTNHGPAQATNVTISDTLPANATYVSATPEQGNCSQPGNVVCDLGTLNSGSAVHVTILVTPQTVGTLTNQVSVSCAEIDPAPGNNTATETTRVGAPSLGAVVLVNSHSAAYGEFERYIRPYLDNFGVPYTLLDIATTAVGTEVADYALVIIGHRQLDLGSTCSGSPCLDSIEQANLGDAVNTGTGLVNFDDDLSADGATARYQFIQDIFGFGYVPAPVGSGVLFGSTAAAHFITARHQNSELIGTGNMTMAGITLPGDATVLATTGSSPFLAVRVHGQGRAVQWGTYKWMSHSVKGPIFGLDDLVWRSLVWAARKPFVMQGMPPFLTMRVDDESGPFDWIHVANEVGIKPWAGLFLSNIDETEAADLSNLVNAGQATTAIHAFDGSWFYWAQSDLQIAANYVTGTQWHNDHHIPISEYVLPHYYQFGTNAFGGLADWGVECVGTQMDPGQGYGASWIMNGPYRLFEGGGSSGGTPQYYADYMTIPGHPEFNDRFFNLVTEIRDDLGYEWYPTNDVSGSVYHGTLQTKRALDSMALATLFTHDQSVSGISMANWRSILQGITSNLVPYHPINVTMDYACQYIRSTFGSNIAGSSYDATNRRVTVDLSGTTEIATKFYLFMDDQGAIRDMWVDVPQFTGQTQVLFTLPDALDHIVVTPAAPSVIAGATQLFAAQGYDAHNNPIPNLPVTWNIANGGGIIDSNGLFTAGATPGTYDNTVVAAVGSVTGSATVTVTTPSLDQFTFQTISSPQYAGAPFQITITARDAAGNLFTGYSGQAVLGASVGTVSPGSTGNFTGGTWTGNVTLDQVAGNVSLTASAGGASGTSNSFATQAVPTLDHFSIQTIASPQIVNAPFQVLITALDSVNNPLPVYTGTPALSTSVGAITPTVTGSFSGATWTGTVTLNQVADNVAITVSDGTATGTSNNFAVQPPPPYFQVTSTSYTQTTGVPFEVNVTAFQTTVNCWEDNHQDPVLATTTDPNVLTYNAAAGQWTEFHYTLGNRPFPSVMASALHTSTLPTMHFYAGGIPNGRYEVIAHGLGLVVANNNYDNADFTDRQQANGRLAEFDGQHWTILESCQFNCITGRNAIGNAIFATGADNASAILKVYLPATGWQTYRLPKATHTQDHAWTTEWPRIREIESERWLMNASGMIYEVPAMQYADRVWGVRPVCTHLRIVADFCSWNGLLVLAGNQNTPIHDNNRFVGQPQAGLWFGKTDDLWQCGKPSGWGGPWWETRVKAGDTERPVPDDRLRAQVPAPHRRPPRHLHHRGRLHGHRHVVQISRSEDGHDPLRPPRFPHRLQRPLGPDHQRHRLHRHRPVRLYVTTRVTRYASRMVRERPRAPPRRSGRRRSPRTAPAPPSPAPETSPAPSGGTRSAAARSGLWPAAPEPCSFPPACRG